jgi:methylmalonyl-CoA/ethylmalonyl-CoA epimerase
MREHREADIRPLSATAPSIATRFGLGPIDQISFAVTSVEQSLPWYEALFGGPFTVRDVILSADAVTYRGAPADAVLRLAFGSTAGIEIELVEVLRGEAPSLEHLREHGDGLHHVRFPVADLEAKKEQLTAAGFEVIFDGTTPRGSSFTYVQAPASLGHTVIEMIQPVASGGSGGAR